jgi:hypothetical protein
MGPYWQRAQHHEHKCVVDYEEMLTNCAEMPAMASTRHMTTVHVHGT